MAASLSSSSLDSELQKLEEESKHRAAQRRLEREERRKKLAEERKKLEEEEARDAQREREEREERARIRRALRASASGEAGGSEIGSVVQQESLKATVVDPDEIERQVRQARVEQRKKEKVEEASKRENNEKCDQVKKIEEEREREKAVKEEMDKEQRERERKREERRRLRESGSSIIIETSLEDEERKKASEERSKRLEERRRQREQAKIQRELEFQRMKEEAEEAARQLQLRRKKEEEEWNRKKEAMEKRNNDERKYLEGRQVPYIRFPEWERLSVEDVFINDIPDYEKLQDHFDKEGRLDRDCVVKLLDTVKSLFAKEPNVLRLSAPIQVYGDVHGQYYDLVNLIRSSQGLPGTNNIQYLFLGDYVDRGTFSIETFLYLSALKINFPSAVHLVRGNHESRSLTTYFNFRSECRCKYGVDIYEAFLQVFQALPLAAIVANEQGNYFCVHGGISPSVATINDIETFDRFQEVPDSGILCDLVWSDPLDDSTIDASNEEQLRQYWNTEFVGNKTRGCSHLYGLKAVENFLKNNNLLMIVRAHEVQKIGYKEHYFKKENRANPFVITVFSAPNYCDKYENRAAILKITETDYSFDCFDWVDHPFYLPNFRNIFKFSLPFVAENIARLCLSLLSICNEEEGNSGSEEEVRARVRSKIRGIGRMMIVMKKLGSDNMLKIASPICRKMGTLSNFETMLEVDKDSEAWHLVA